jgi:lipoprotein NlpD
LIRIGIVFLIIGFLLPACSGKSVKTMKASRAKGVYHRVKGGESLYLIARAYNVEVQELAETNNIEDPNRIEADSVVFIPDARQVIDDVMASVKRTEPSPVKQTVRTDVIEPRAETFTGISTIRINQLKVLDKLSEMPLEEKKDTAFVPEKEPRDRPATKASESADKPAVTQVPAAVTPSIQFDRKRFIWPVKGRVGSRFGIQPNGMHSNGITIIAGEAIPVVAAAEGVVILSGHVKGYGETIIIEHKEHYATVYTNIGQRKVKYDDRVKQGDVIGLLAKKDQREGDPRLNFEIRHHSKARNPAFFLP